MKLTILQLGVLGANCYLLELGEGRALAIDIGGDPERLLGVLHERGLTLEAILITHGHYDHVGGVEAVREATGAAVYVHEADAAMLQSGQKNLAWHFTDAPFDSVKEFITVTDNQTLTIGGVPVTVLHTPGHTPGGVCYRIGEALFTGDTLFCGSIGRIDLGGNRKDMLASLQRLAALEGDYAVYPGHGESSTLNDERQHNPYMGAL